jgi:hypothetical protein
MNLKDLFNQNSIVSNTSLSELTSSVESPGLIEAIVESKKKFYPNIDYSNPKNFARFGLAEEYYKNSIQRIYNTYPYDGSHKEKILFHNSSSYLDTWIWEKKYPKTNGCIYFDTNTGTLIQTVLSVYKLYNNSKYIQIQSGGPNLDNIFISGTKEDNFSFVPSDGYTIQFWLKKNSFKSSSISNIDTYINFVAYSNSTGSAYENIFSISNTSITTDRFDIVQSVGDNPEAFVYHPDSLSASISTLDWNHYTFTNYYDINTDIKHFKIYKNGTLTNYKTTSAAWGADSGSFGNSRIHLSGAIGSRSPSAELSLTGSGFNNAYDTYIDDFRFFDRAITEEEIKKNWYKTIHGGQNTDANVYSGNLGLYYKFNEGITQTSSVDSVVLDYSGRNTDATIINYSASMRITSSAFVDYGLKETPDPIIYSFHNDVSNLETEYINIGNTYDNLNSNALINTFPQHIIEEDYESDQNLLKLTQILSSQFDEIYIQTEQLTNIKSNSYLESGSWNEQLLIKNIENSGLKVEDIFGSVEPEELFGDTTANIEFDSTLQKIKTNLYKNLYNNIITINKSKGTEYSLRNTLRSFGVDDDIYKLKIYSNNNKFKINDVSKYQTSKKKKVLDLSGITDAQNIYGCVHQYADGIDAGSISFFGGASATSDDLHNMGITLETNVQFPKLTNYLDNNYFSLPTQYATASIFGILPVIQDGPSITAGDMHLNTNYVDNGSVTEYSSTFLLISKKSNNSAKAKFILRISGTQTDIDYESDYYDIYDNSKWCLSLTYTQSTDIYNNLANTVKFYGIKEQSGQIIEEVTLTGSFGLPAAAGTVNGYLSIPKKIFIGAYRNNLTGNTVIYPTQAKFLTTRFWYNNLSEDTIKQHAKDIFNYGISGTTNHIAKPYNSVIGTTQIYKTYIPKYNSLLLNWDFENLTGSDSSGEFSVQPFGSGTTNLYPISSNYYDDGDFTEIGRRATGKGFGFNTNTSSMFKTDYYFISKNKEIDNLISANSVDVIDDEDTYFGQNIKPISYFYTVENSPYSILSDEMMNLFDTMKEFNNLIGQDYFKYQEEYKLLNNIREFFFRRVRNNIKVSTYVEYFKWFDLSLTNFVKQLFPVSSENSNGIYNIIESHVLERNKVKHELFKIKPKNKQNLTISIKDTKPSWNPYEIGGPSKTYTWEPPNGTPRKIIKPY